MERNIPHVLDVFTSSPGAKRRFRHTETYVYSTKESQKSPSSDSAVSVSGSSDEEDEISKYFHYLDEDGDTTEGSYSKKKKLTKKKKKSSKTTQEETRQTKEDEINYKELSNIERHLSMKKTIRKKIMRDLQKAFVEDPCDLQAKPDESSKNKVDLQKMTFGKKRLSKSEQNFLEILKDRQTEKQPEERTRENVSKAKQKLDKKLNNNQEQSTHVSKALEKKCSDNNKNFERKEVSKNRWEKTDDDSGNESPTRIKLPQPPKETDKKPSFWKRLTGKGKTRR